MMTRMLAVVLSLSMLAPVAGSAMYQFTGVITDVEGTLPAPFAGTTPGDGFTCVVTFDASATDQAPDDSAIGLYPFSQLSLTIGSGGASTNVGTITITNDLSADLFTLQASLPGPPDSPTYTMILGMTDLLGSAYASDVLPGAVDPADFDIRFLSLRGESNPNNTIAGTIDVPEPGVLALFCCGVATIWQVLKRST